MAKHYTDVLIGRTVKEFKIKKEIPYYKFPWAQSKLSKVETGETSLYAREFLELCDFFEITPNQFYKKMNTSTTKKSVTL